MSSKLLLIDEQQGVLLRRGRIKNGKFFAYPNGTTLIDIGRGNIYRFSAERADGIGLYADPPFKRRLTADLELPMKTGYFVRGLLVDYTPGDQFLLVIHPDSSWESVIDDAEEEDEEEHPESPGASCPQSFGLSGPRPDNPEDYPQMPESGTETDRGETGDQKGDEEDSFELDDGDSTDAWKKGTEYEETEAFDGARDESGLVVEDAADSEDLDPFIYCRAAVINRNAIDLTDAELEEFIGGVMTE